MMNNVAILFPGGGSHYQGMGKNFYESSPAFREVFDEASDILSFDLKRVAFERTEAELGDMDSHLVIFTIAVGMYRAYRLVAGCDPLAFAGHSLGEYSALTCAGVLDLPEALQIVKHRAGILSKAGITNDGKMMAVSNADRADVVRIVDSLQAQGHAVYISNYNAPQQVVLSGMASSLIVAVRELTVAGADTITLPIPTCSHSPLLSSTVDEYRNYLRRFTFRQPGVKVYSNVTAAQYKDELEIADRLAEHLVSPVLWQQTIDRMSREGVIYFIEMGPGEVLTKLNYAISPVCQAISYDAEGDRAAFIKSIETERRNKFVKMLDNVLLGLNIPSAASKIEVHEKHDCYRSLTELKKQYLQDAFPLDTAKERFHALVNSEMLEALT